MTDTRHLTPGITEKDIIEEYDKLHKLTWSCSEEYANARYGLLRAWVNREAKENDWPASRLAAALGEVLIRIAVDTLAESIAEERK